MRLDKYIADTTHYSRADAKRLLKQQLVMVNEQTVTNPGYQVQSQDQVCLDQQLLEIPRPRYVMFHKPEGVICASSADNDPIVSDYIDLPNRHLLQIVGRLDKDTTGLVLLTDDGQWNHKVTTPRRGCYKHYRVTLAAPATPELVVQFQQGLWLRGESRPTLPATLTIHSEYQVELAIQEGKYHQVKRMFGVVNNRVIALHRFRIGDIDLDAQLAPGSYRHLTPNEVASFG